MPTTTYKAYPLPTQGVTTTWGDALNNYPFTYIDDNLGGITTKTLSNATVNLTVDESRMAILRLIGTLSANVLVTTVCQGFVIVENLTSGAYSVTLGNVATYGGSVVGTPVTVPQSGRYVVATDTTNGARLVLPSGSSSTVGMIADFVGTTVPSGWLKANGALVSRASYPALWAYANASGNIQTEADWTANAMYGCFSTGDTSTTFRLPDLRGTFRRCWADDNTSSLDYGRTAGSWQTQAVLNHTHPVTITDPGHYHFQFNTNSVNGVTPLTNTNYPVYNLAGSGLYINYQISGSALVPTIGRSSTATTGITASTSNNTGGSTQNIPANTAFMTCIAYV